MHVGIPGFVNDIVKGKPAFKWDIGFVPKGPAKRATIVQGPSSACIAQSKNLDIACEWLVLYNG